MIGDILKFLSTDLCGGGVHQIATRKAYGVALAKLGRYNERVVVLDGDTKNSTFSELFKNEHPNRYVECYIAEQNMVRNLRHFQVLEWGDWRTEPKQ